MFYIVNNYQQKWAMVGFLADCFVSK